MTFLPTHIGDTTMSPACCFLCGRRAIGIGFGQASRGDPKWVCEECLTLGAIITSVKRFDVYEERALAAVIDNVGPIVEANGTDLGEWSGDQVEAFAKAIVTGYGTALRDEIKKGQAPF